MLLLFAGTLQMLLLTEVLLRRVLYLFFSAKRSAVQRYADNSVLGSAAAAAMQALTVPLQAVASLLASGARVWALFLLLAVVFSVLTVMSNSSVYAYSAIVRMYNTGVAPVVGALKWISIITDFIFRAAVPLYNGVTFLISQVLRHILVPYSFNNVDTLPELLQGVALALGTLGQSTVTLFGHVQACTVGYEDVLRVCGANSTRGADCATVFAPLDLRCHAMPTHLSLDLLTPGLFARQAVESVQGMVANSCGLAAIVLNLAMYPLADVHVYAAVHAAVNTVLFTLVGMPVSTWRRCRALEQRARESPSALRPVHIKVGCTPDWQPVAAMAESSLESLGKAVDNWLNAAAVAVHERTTGRGLSCESNVPLKEIVLDAARAIEGLESIEALEKLQGRNGVPESETLRSVRVIGLTPTLFGVTDGKSVLYRSAHDGYVLAFGAWPLHVDVRYGLAAVTYSGSATEADSSGAARTGLLGCRCVDDREFSLVCATAPYVQHIDDELAGLNVSSLHRVSFHGLVLSGMTCANTAVRVMPLRWPRRRLATTEGGGGGFTGYDRFSFQDTVARYTGDADATDNLRLLAARERAMPSGAVEAAIYVQPVCSNDKSVSCAPTERATCFPWCMGLVRGGRRAQNITMYNARSWEEHIVLPGVDCGVERDKGTCEALPAGASSPLVDLMGQEGLVRGRCAASCTPAPVAASVMSLVPLEEAARTADANSTLGLVQQHKKVWTAARLEQPVVVAGDTMLTISTDVGGKERLVVTRLFDIGQSTLQMASERLTLASNAHAAEVATCATQDDVACVARSMMEGKVVLPPAVRTMHGDVADAGFVLPAAASRWAVHWAQNPEVSVYNNLFEYCRNATPEFSLTVHSSYARARVWTLQTMRAVDLEQEGTPSEKQTRSRVSYMRVPYFLGETDFNQRACGKVVGLQVVGVEYLNEQNVLVTVLAARPRDYNPRTGNVDGPRTHRYYYLHPGRSDCVRADEEDALPENPRIFSCWRSHASGMWPADDLLTGGIWGGDSGGRCTRPRVVPEFGTWAVMPAIALVRIAETTLDAVCTLAAVIAADTQNPVRALDELFTVELQQSTFHATVDSAGARLLAVDGFIDVADWLAAFNARLVSFVVNALTSVSVGQEQVDKSVQGVRTLVVAGTKVYEGMPRVEQPFERVEKLFREPIAYSGLHASVAVLTMADGVKEGVAMPAVVRAFMAAQLQLVSVMALSLRLGRVVLLRLIQSIGVAADGRQNAATSIVSAALLESRSIVQNDYLSIMRFQCYGFAQMAGSEYSWGQALRHTCLLLPDTLEGVLTVGSVLTLEYPVVACACTLGEGDALDSPNEAVVSICLQRPMPAENTQWLLALRFVSATRQDVCFAAMDSANVRLYTAFDKSFKRLYQMARHAAHVTDGLLALVTGDTVACDAFDVSPYVVSIIPEPVDYFSSCVETDDCVGRCNDEYTVFEEERRARQSEHASDSLGLSTSVEVPLESLLFSLDDIQQGRHKPPFQILDAAEMPPHACAVVCSRSAPVVGTRCVAVAGIQGRDLAVAYYCLPIDITQYVYQWPGMEAFTLPPAGTQTGFPVIVGTLRSVYVASTWAALRGARDSLIAVVDTEDESASDSHFMGSPARVTRVLWCVPSMPAREIMRTSLLSERRLDAAPSSMLLAKTYMYAIEHLQVDVADSDQAQIAVRAYGFHTKVTDAGGAPSWSAPESVCIECVFESDPSLFASASCEACAADGASAESVRQHVRLCMRSEPETSPREKPLACADALELPTQGDSVAGFVTQARKSHATLRTPAANKLLSVPASTLNVLRNDARNGVYMDMQQRAHARISIVSSVAYPPASRIAGLRNISINAPSAAVELEVVAVNAQRSQGAWMHVLSLRVDGDSINGAQRGWLRSSALASVHLNCSVRSCGACAYTTAGDALHSLRRLENLCYAAQQCGIERCAGTLVNMRKPLCNLGNVLVNDLHQVRILLQGLWGAIADNIAMIVELTHERRQLYQIKWPEKLVRQEACTAKDTLVSAAATITSIFGAFSHLMQDVSLHHGFVGSSVDARVHARYIMVLTSITNMLSSIFMWPVYQGLVLQKWFACTTNDLLLKIDTLIGPGNGQISLRFGDPRASEAIAQAGIAVCMSEDVSQSLQDTGARVREAGAAGGGGDPAALRVMRKLTDAISSTLDFGLASYVQYAYHVMDISLAWSASVIKGMMDVAQTADWQNCKLPVVDTGLQSIGMCACGDHEYAVVAAEKSKGWAEHAFWCSGFLLLNAGDGSDLTVWNPYSLQQLLEIKGRQGNGYSDFITCLRERWRSTSPYHLSTCEEFKPVDTRLRRQGVDVLQVISRCRSNYQQSRWDEGSALLGLFDPDEWTNMRSISSSHSARKDDKYVLLRRRLMHLLDNDADLRSENTLRIAAGVWNCLQDAMHAGMLQHTCHRSVSSFVYERPHTPQPAHVDACRVLSGETDGLEFPRFLWSGNSRNHVPLAKLHALQLTHEQRVAAAEEALTKLLAQIKKEFDSMLDFSSFSEELASSIRVESFSADGDELHQLVDCVIMGPYSAADLNTNVHLDNVAKVPVPQYHRGSAGSREFTSSTETGGSSARRDIMHTVFEFVNSQASDILVREVGKQVSARAQEWLERDNFKCACSGGARGYECCVDSSDFVLQSMPQDQFDLQESILAETLQQVADSKFLQETIWTRRSGNSIPLRPEHRAALHEAQMFRSSGKVPVRTYGVDDTATALNERSLWETCTGSVAGMFATLPHTDETVNVEQGRAKKDSRVHIPAAAFAQFDASVTYAADRVHSMEILVDALLERSRALAPHFWTHAHRYVASDSVWCERAQARDAADPRVIKTPARIKQQKLRQEDVLAPHPDELLYPADVLKTCACGWVRNDLCYVPSDVCSKAPPEADRVWEELCAGATYSAEDKGKLLAVLAVLSKLDSDILAGCSARRVSIAWGLLSPSQQHSWYAGARLNWTVDAQHVATLGPGGLRLGMLSPAAAESLEQYVQRFSLGDALRDTFHPRYGHTIAQPVCEGQLRDYLKDDMRRYFADVFVPMAHSVQVVPAVEYCVRWAIEHAMLHVLRRATGTPQVAVDEQQSAANLWRSRCAAQMHEVGLCQLRGVLETVPEAADVPHSAQPSQACAFAGPGHVVTNCVRRYYTSACLLYCDGAFYDPCMCSADECAPRPFDPSACARGLLVDGSVLLDGGAATHESLLTSSLSWPADILPGEADNDTHWQNLRAALSPLLRASKVDNVNFNALFSVAADVLIARADEETEPYSYCDDLVDYWPDVQHPVGYHPSTACTAEESRTRGFTSWMSRDAQGRTLIDPVRMRNMTLASQVFGAAHLVCDAHAYAAPGHRLNPYFMESRWDSKAHADPTIPAPAAERTVDEMPTLGKPSYRDTDTTLREHGHTAALLLQHSVGLVRAWAQWLPRDASAEAAAEAAAAQHVLDTQWPHWLPAEEHRGSVSEHAGLFLGSREGSASPPAGCSFPPLLRCRKDSDCSRDTHCLLNWYEEENTRRGVCMPAGSCYQHAHCAGDLLCSGEGACVEPTLFVVNDADWDSEIQLFAKAGCGVSMQRVSRFESIPDFARANGMCSFRNWYHFKNVTAGAASHAQGLLSVQDRLVLRTDRAEAQTLESLAVLKTLGHPCDRSYSHSDFTACFGHASVTEQRSGATTPAVPVQAARTWTLRDASWHANFCQHQGASTVAGFLSPYNVDTLHSAARDITRCSKLGLCPSTSFHLRGHEVETRRVLVHKLSEDSPHGVAAESAARDYCALDAQRCWGMGHLLGADCAEVDSERSALCVVDALVLPLLPVVYGSSALRTAADFSAQLLMLRSNCPHAFKQSFDGRADVSLFEHVFVHLTQPYAWTDTARRQRVLEYSNALFLFVFGDRGINSVQHYLEHSSCAVFVARALYANEERFAEKARLGLVFYHSSLAGGPLQPALPVLPGASLYLVDRRLPVSINLRWLMQCLVLAKDSVEGGVPQSFITELNSGALAARADTVECVNYRHESSATDSMPLASWLRKARYLFTQVDSAELNPVQISEDIYSSIRKALAQLPVLDMPDLLCVTSDKGWTQTTGQSVFGMQNALEHLERFRNPALAFGVTAQQTTLANTERIFTDAGSSSIYAQVLNYLVEGTRRSAAAWQAQSAVTLAQLVEDGVLEHNHILEKQVSPKDMYPRYEYVNLKKLPLLYGRTLAAEASATLETYTRHDTEQLCTCSSAQQAELSTLCENRRRLLKPEYSLSSKVLCAGLRVLPCDAEGVTRLLDKRSSMRTPFLSQDELLYLILLVFQYEISYTASGGFTTLHRIRDAEKAQFVDELYAVALPRNANRISLHEAQQFNEYLEQHDAASIKCPPTELDYFQETNQRHRQMRQCRDSLRESIGWSLPRRHVLVIRPQRETLMSGFYLAHLESPKDTFLDTLFDTQWTDAEHTSYDVAICNTRPEQTSVMAPFWAEYFDVASDDNSDQPSLACDIESSSAGSILMVYDTLCSSSSTSTTPRECRDHPNYKSHLEKSMSAACARSDGRVVVRRHIGALQKGKGKLCDLEPLHMDQTCALKHGALNGHAGEQATDLDNVLPVSGESIQRGLWDPANDIFRGRQSRADLLAAMALNKEDIAGHCLGFGLSSQGILTLRSAALSSHCEASNAAMSDTAVRKWLADVVQEWAWDHAHTSAIHAQEGSAEVAPASVAWTCPLHWHQQYHDDGGRHQARSPSWQRNSARFHHITGANHYAHPTVRHANRLRGIRAARFLGDGIACVAAAELCHSVAYLNTVIQDILQPAWRPVAFVPERHPECNRTLDWPADCGKASPGTPHVGTCVLRT